MRKKKKRIYFNKKVEKDQLELYKNKSSRKFTQQPKIISFYDLILALEKSIPI